MLRLRSIFVGRLGHFCSVGQRTCRRTTLTAGDKWARLSGISCTTGWSAERSATTRPMLFACASIDSCAMGEDRVDPEICLRSLTAEALLWAYPQGPLPRCVLSG